jgi:putative polyhydroxyalkanoate system protein
MASIELSRAHHLNLDDAKAKVESLANEMKKLGVNYSWSGYNVVFDATSGMAKGVKGSIKITEGNVAVSLSLPMMLSFMKSTIENKINQELNKIL